LSGDGGDEAFAGYDFRYVPHAIEGRLRAAAGDGALARGAFRLGAAAWPRQGWLPRPLRLGTLLDNLAVDPAEAYFRDLCFNKPEVVRRLLGRPPAPARDLGCFDAVTAAYRRCPSSDPVQKAEYEIG